MSNNNPDIINKINNKYLFFKKDGWAEKSELFKQLELDGFCNYLCYKNMIVDVIKETNAKSILETGFFLGSSSFMFLESSDASVVSIDPMGFYDPPKTGLRNADRIGKAFPNRFRLIVKRSQEAMDDVKDTKFDLMFIDGDHETDGIIHDFEMAIKLNIPYIFIDDFNGKVEDVYFNYYANKTEVIKGYGIQDSGNIVDNLLVKNLLAV